MLTAQQLLTTLTTIAEASACLVTVAIEPQEGSGLTDEEIDAWYKTDVGSVAGDFRFLS
jgi:hypothetical protein